jgi:prolycopene isomerase
LLANKGLDVLVIEQHYLPGGVCTSIKRHDAAMDAGAALLFGWTTENSSHHFVMNVLEEDIDMIPHEAIYRMNLDNGKTLTFWRDFERYFQELSEVFPEQKDGLRGFYEESFKIFDLLNSMPFIGTPETMPKAAAIKLLLKDPRGVMQLPKIMNTSTKAALDKWVQDPVIEGLFDVLIASCYCTKLEETPMMLGAAIVCNTHGEDGGACYPAGSPQMLPNKLEKAFEKKGGQVLYRHMVDEILVKDNAAYGVRLPDGTEILANKIVSDADIYHLYGKLLRPEHIKPERLAWANHFVPSFGAVIIYLVVDKEAIPEGTRNIEAIIGNLEVLEKEKYFVYIPSIDDPSICPEDAHSISVLCSTGDLK